jgi:hypothetical protein
MIIAVNKMLICGLVFFKDQTECKNQLSGNMVILLLGYV